MVNVCIDVFACFIGLLVLVLERKEASCCSLGKHVGVWREYVLRESEVKLCSSWMSWVRYRVFFLNYGLSSCIKSTIGDEHAICSCFLRVVQYSDLSPPQKKFILKGFNVLQISKLLLNYQYCKFNLLE